MYRALSKILFLVPPERIHTWVFAFLRAVTAPGPVRRALARWLAPHDPVLESTVFGVRFPGPLGLAAGFDKDGTGLNTWGALGFGYAEVGTVTAAAQPGNPKPRMFRLADDHAHLEFEVEPLAWPKTRHLGARRLQLAVRPAHLGAANHHGRGAAIIADRHMQPVRLQRIVLAAEHDADIGGVLPGRIKIGVPGNLNRHMQLHIRHRHQRVAAQLVIVAQFRIVMAQ